MLTDRIERSLLSFAPPQRVLRGVPASAFTTFRIGGNADLLFCPASEEELVRALEICPDAAVIGAGSNILVSDRGIRGLTVLLSRDMVSVTAREDGLVTAQAGTPLPRLASFAQSLSLSGLEFAGGIPGSVGGAAAMNAGAYGGEIAQVLESARLYENGAVVTVPCCDMRYGYRTSRVLTGGGVVLSCSFRLEKGDKEAIASLMRDLAARRRDKQPLSLPSAGSFFKRPQGHFAGKLIEDASLKGLRVGGAMVSEKHAGFIVNAGGATCRDVLELADRVVKAVYDMSGVTLEREVRLIGEM